MTSEHPEEADQVTATAVDDTVEVEILGPSAEALGLDLPDDDEAARSILLDALGEARSESSQHLEQLQRIAAEYDNFRRRAERDRLELTSFATRQLVQQLLPTLDNLGAALAHEPQSPGEETLLEGMRGTYAQLTEALGAHGFATIPTDGVPFDPAVHEAISGPGDGDGHLVIDQELRQGYAVHGHVVRPALVTVRYDEAGGEAGGDSDA